MKTRALAASSGVDVRQPGHHYLRHDHDVASARGKEVSHFMRVRLEHEIASRCARTTLSIVANSGLPVVDSAL